MSKTFFTSDLHFGHRRILEFTQRGSIVQSVNDMDEWIIAVWNENIAPADKVYVLGDFSFKKPIETAEIVDRLNGEIYLVKGNHDYDRASKSRLQWSGDYKEIVAHGRKICLFHFPIEEWARKRNGSLHFHGHLHSTNPFSMNRCRVDVGWDAWHRPIEAKELLGICASVDEAIAVWKDVDYHGKDD